MKRKHIVALAACLVALPGFAQLLNSNFQNWSTTSINQDSAHHWSSTNLSVHNITSMVTTLSQGAGSSKNSSAAELHTTPFGFVQTPVVGILVNGKAKLDFDAVRTSYVSGGGSPIISNPLALEGYYKINGPYDGLVTVLISRYNTSTTERDTLALVSMNLASSATTTTSFNLPINYTNPAITGDSITVVFHSSDPSVVPGTNCLFSTLSIDSLHLVENIADGSISEIETLNANDTVNAPHTIEAKIKNLGSMAISNFDLSYTVNGASPVKETFAGSINPGDSAIHAFSQKWTPAQAGDYDLCVYLNGIVNDAATLNDTSCLSLRSTLDLNNHKPIGLELYPNPANQQLNLKLDMPASIIVFDQLGKAVANYPSARTFQVNTAGYPPGVYSLHIIEKASGTTIKRIPIMILH